jgi:hypothetical protein
MAQLIERSGEGGGYTLHETQHGYRVEQWSRIEGAETLGVYSVAHDAAAPYLAAEPTAEQYEQLAEAVLAGELPRRTLRRPIRVE